MKDKQIKIEKTIFYMLLLLVMVYRGVILFKYSFYYVDDDQALMWYGTVSFAHFWYGCLMDLKQEYVKAKAMAPTKKLREDYDYRLFIIEKALRK